MSDGSPPPLPENGPATEVMRPRSARSAAAARRVGYLVAILVNVVLRYLANGVPHWNVPFITNDWPDVLWAINLSLGAAIAANLIFLVFDPRWFRRSAQIVLNALSIVATRALYQVFPFDLGRASYEQAARWALLALIVALAIATIIEFLGLILGRDR